MVFVVAHGIAFWFYKNLLGSSHEMRTYHMRAKHAEHNRLGSAFCPRDSRMIILTLNAATTASRLGMSAVMLAYLGSAWRTSVPINSARGSVTTVGFYNDPRGLTQRVIEAHCATGTHSVYNDGDGR